MVTRADRGGDEHYSPDNPPPDQLTYSCPCGTGEEPCPVNGVPACDPYVAEDQPPACATKARRSRTAEQQIADEAADAYERDMTRHW